MSGDQTGVGHVHTERHHHRGYRNQVQEVELILQVTLPYGGNQEHVQQITYELYQNLINQKQKVVGLSSKSHLQFNLVLLFQKNSLEDG